MLEEPSRQRIAGFLDSRRDATLSYAEVGASRENLTTPVGYAVDHNRVRLGEGREAFDRAVAALRAWKMFDAGWVSLVPADAPVEVGMTVAVLARHYGFWSLNPSRIVYTIEEKDEDFVKCGFAYGTLSGHAQSGEERFTILWRRDDGSVFYDLYAFSRPDHALARLGRPLARGLQRRFARDSLRAMVRAAGEGSWPGC